MLLSKIRSYLEGNPDADVTVDDLIAAIKAVEEKQATCKHGSYVGYPVCEFDEYDADFCPDCGKDRREVKS